MSKLKEVLDQAAKKGIDSIEPEMILELCGEATGRTKKEIVKGFMEAAMKDIPPSYAKDFAFWTGMKIGQQYMMAATSEQLEKEMTQKIGVTQTQLGIQVSKSIIGAIIEIELNKLKQ